MANDEMKMGDTSDLKIVQESENKNVLNSGSANLVEIEEHKVPHQSDFVPGIFKQRHMEAGAKFIFFGLAADRPDGSTWVKAYFATDTGVLSCWNGTAWVSTTLS